MTIRYRKNKSNKKKHQQKKNEIEDNEDERLDFKKFLKNDSKYKSLVKDKAKTENDIEELEKEKEELEEKIEIVIEHDEKVFNFTKHFYEKKRYILLIGIIFGIFIAGYFTTKTVLDKDFLPALDEYIKLDSLSFDSMTEYFDDWKDVLPDSLQNTILIRTNEEKNETGSFSVGRILKKEGYKSKYNVIMVPGVVSTGLESWGLEGTEECPSEPHFRKRLWGSFYMLRTMFLDKACWLKHIMLDPKTGLDPPGIKLRAAQGFEAADFFVAGYWIWNKVLENLAVIGYATENMFSAAYDWRLSYLDLERRDGYFSKLKAQIELTKELNNEKTVLYGHSMGSQVIFYFLKWVEAEGSHFGNGGKSWVNDHIEAYVDISGTVLGTPKAITALLSGEMKDTVQLNGLAVYGLEKFFSRRERSDMLKSFGGIASMLPKGGSLIWGDINSSPDDCLNLNSTICKLNDTYGNFIRFDEPVGIFSDKNLTMSNSIEFLLNQGPTWFADRTMEHYSYGFAKSEQELYENEKNFNKWSNPLEVPLPNAPDMKIYCFYGVGKPTERAYYYKEEEDKAITKLNITIDQERKDSVLMSEGDGTVSLLSHYMCHKWKEEGNIYNPGNSEVTVVEILHQPNSFDIRGGSKTAEHVDILGSALLNELLLKVASGNGHRIRDNYITKLKEIASKIDARTYYEGEKRVF